MDKPSSKSDKRLFAQLIYVNTMLLIMGFRFPYNIKSTMNLEWLIVNLLNFFIPFWVAYIAYKLYRPSVYKIYALSLIVGSFIAIWTSSIIFTNYEFGFLIIWMFIVISIPLSYLIIFEDNPNKTSHFQFFRLGLALLLFLPAQALPISVWSLVNNHLSKSVPIVIGFIIGLGVAYFSFKNYRSSVYKTYVYSYFLGFCSIGIVATLIYYYNAQLVFNLMPFSTPLYLLILLLPSLIDLANGDREDSENNRLLSIEAEN